MYTSSMLGTDDMFTLTVLGTDALRPLPLPESAAKKLGQQEGLE